MSPFEYLLAGYLELLLLLIALYIIFGEREWLGGALFAYCYAPFLVAPLALWLLIDGTWSAGDMKILGAAMAGFIFLTSCGEYLQPVRVVRATMWLCRAVVEQVHKLGHPGRFHRRSNSV